MDAALFRFVNQSLSNPFFDWLMPVLSGNKLFMPMVLVAAVALIWKQRTKGALCVAFIAIAVSLGDPLIINSIKHAVMRPRPFVAMPEAITLVGRTESFSLPSAHAANMAAAAMVAFLFFRRSWRFMVPLAAAVAISRIYNGAHYVSDVLVGAALGGGYAAMLVWAMERVWQWAGRKWFPLWWAQLPSLCDFGSSATGAPLTSSVKPSSSAAEKDPPTTADTQHATRNTQLLNLHWLRLGYLVIALFLLARLAYIGGSAIELSEDEAYQWQWSKHPAFAYYSKPPGIAVAQWIGTHLWGDTAFGVRFLAPCVTALISVLLLRFFAREATAKLGLFVVLAATATPLLSVGAVLMTVDCLSVLFWTLAMLSGWQAVRANPVGRDSVEPHLERSEASAASISAAAPRIRLVLRLSRNIQTLAEKEFHLRDGQVLLGDPPAGPIVFLETGIRFEAEVIRGQKTGFFLDQRENRRRVETLAAGRDVLNAFSFSGGFSLYAARGGARSTTDLDISPHALDSARRNFALNTADPRIAACRHECAQADTFDWLAASTRPDFDLVILDPPSLAKRETERAGAIQAYRKLAVLGLPRLRRGGILVAASCSAHVSTAEFFGAVLDALHDSRRPYAELLRTTHAPDHPATFPEAQYLKCLFVQLEP